MTEQRSTGSFLFDIQVALIVFLGLQVLDLPLWVAPALTFAAFVTIALMMVVLAVVVLPRKIYEALTQPTNTDTIPL